MVSVRSYQPSDQVQIRWLHGRTPPAGQVATRPQPWPDDLERISESYIAFWVAVEPFDDSETVVGMVGLSDPRLLVQSPHSDSVVLPVPQLLILDESTLRMDRIRVAPERQRRGIGRLLTQTTIDWARVRGYQRLILDTTSEQAAAIALYEALGFQERGRTAHGRWSSSDRGDGQPGPVWPELTG